jgi:hypothetical protein
MDSFQKAAGGVAVMTNSERFAALFERGGIHTRRVKALGQFVHVDTFHKYEDHLNDLMSAAGFKLVSRSDGRHMDSVDGFRLVYRVMP